MVFSSPCLTDIKNWLVQSKRLLQTDFGKDFSNPLMVDSLPKTIWLSMHHVIVMKHWLFQSKWLLLVLDFYRRLDNTSEQDLKDYQIGINSEDPLEQLVEPIL
ncbi:hypothetical protein Tco_0643506 [Tanacetum coccineum]